MTDATEQVQTEPHDQQTPGEPVHESQEVLVYRHYRSLRNQVRDIGLESDNIRDTEIIPDMEAGVVFGEGEGYLRFEYTNGVKFDFQAARTNKTPRFDVNAALAAGAISQEILDQFTVLTPDIPDDVWKQYTSVEVSRKVMNRAFNDKWKEEAEKQLAELTAKVAGLARKGKPVHVLTGDELEELIQSRGEVSKK